MADTDPSGRFHLVEAPAAAPGVDWITRSAVGPFIDTGLDVKFAEYGRLYISVATLTEMATVAGLFDSLVSIPSGDILQDEYNRGRDDELKENLVGHLRDVAAELAAAADRLTGGGDSPGAPSAEADAAPVAPKPSRQRAASKSAGVQSDDSPRTAVEGADKAAAAPRQPRGQGSGNGRQRGRADVPSGASNDNPFKRI